MKNYKAELTCFAFCAIVLTVFCAAMFTMIRQSPVNIITCSTDGRCSTKTYRAH